MNEISDKDVEKANDTIFAYQNQKFKKLYGEGFPCICCDNLIKAIRPDSVTKPESEMYHKALVDTITAGYGSKFDCETYLIAICDDCITNLKNNKKLILYKNR